MPPTMSPFTRPFRIRSSMASLRYVAPPLRLLSQKGADDAARQEQHQDDGGESQDQQVEQRELPPDQLVEPDHGHGAEDRAGDGAEPAGHGVNYRLGGDQGVEGGLGVDDV